MLANWLLVWVFAAPSFADLPAGEAGWQWETDLEAAQRTARQTNRLVLIHFGGPWCEPCQRLEQQVFNQPGFGRELEAKYVAVKVDPHANRALAEKYGIRSVPTDVVITARGQLVYKVGSPNTPAAYTETMNRIAASVMPLDAIAAGPEAKPEPPPQPPAAPQPDQVHDPADRYAAYERSRQPAKSTAARAQAGQPRPLEDARSTASTTEPRPNGLNASSAGSGNRLATAAQYQGEVALAQPRPTGIATASRSGDATPAIPAADLHTHVPARASEMSAPGAHPPLALDGYCAVALVEKRQWQRGDQRWGAVHRGRTYLFVSQDAQQAFLANPDHYSPVFSGNDPVMRLDHHQNVPGRREHGAFYNERVYLFASEETFRQFDREPNRYATEARQAMRR
ncbi:MAG: hypothetical protein B7Z73_07015 [Planctomycetia bacterium 21-64-5]|nr:MAG: hypothetical protein B7Z73_07015 [Planctomycetia bacterium 21-64-5]HQU45524.1 thioredoxin family protein [Pirellulales bacterium]